MNPQSTLDAVREISERALLRPAPSRLRLTKPDDLRAGPRPAPIAWEDLHTPKIGGDRGTAGNHKAHKQRKVDHCPSCGKRPEYCYCNVKPREKTEAATERRPVVIPFEQ